MKYLIQYSKEADTSIFIQGPDDLLIPDEQKDFVVEISEAEVPKFRTDLWNIKVEKGKIVKNTHEFLIPQGGLVSPPKKTDEGNLIILPEEGI